MAPSRGDDRKLQEVFDYFNEINIIAQLSTNAFERDLPYGLTASQFSALNWLVRVDAIGTPTRMARAFQVTKGAMTNTLRKLEDKGFITLEPDPDSRRSKLVRMTPRGARARNAAIAATFPRLRQMLRDIPIDDLRAQMPSLQAVRAYLDREREA